MAKTPAVNRTVRVMIDRMRVLRIDHNAIAEFEGKAGVDFISLGKNPAQLNSVRIQGLLLWCSMLHEDPTLTPKDVNEMLDKFVEAGGEKLDVINAVSEALVKSEVYGAAKAKEEEAGDGAGKGPTDPDSTTPPA